MLNSNCDLLYGCLDSTSACGRAGADPLRSGGAYAAVEETVGTEPLLPATAASG